MVIEMGIEQKAEVMDAIDGALRYWSKNDRGYIHAGTPEYLEKFRGSMLKCGRGPDGIYVELDRGFFTSDFFLVNRIFPSMINGLRNKLSLVDCRIVCGGQEIELSPIEHIIGSVWSGGRKAGVYGDSDMPTNSTPERLAKDFMALVRAEAVSPTLNKAISWIL